MTSFSVPRAGRGWTPYLAPGTERDAPKISTSYAPLQAEWLKGQAKARKCSVAAVIRAAVQKEMDDGEA